MRQRDASAAEPESPTLLADAVVSGPRASETATRSAGPKGTVYAVRELAAETGLRVPASSATSQLLRAPDFQSTSSPAVWEAVQIGTTLRAA